MTKIKNDKSKTEELPKTEAGGCSPRYFGRAKMTKDQNGNIKISIKKD